MSCHFTINIHQRSSWELSVIYVTCMFYIMYACNEISIMQSDLGSILQLGESKKSYVIL